MWKTWFFLCVTVDILPVWRSLLTFFDDERAFLGLGGGVARAAHVLGEDPEEVLVPHHQLRDGDAAAVVVLDARVPLLRKQIEACKRKTYFTTHHLQFQ